MEKTMDKIVSLAKARGFVYPGSEIYGGLANTWDYIKGNKMRKRRVFVILRNFIYIAALFSFK